MGDSIFGDVITVVIGLAGGYAISYFFHKKQGSESDNSHDKLIAALDRIYEQALRNGVKHSNVIHLIRSIEDEVGRLSDLVEIKEKMDDALSTLKAIKRSDEPPLEQILRYKTLGDKWSELISTKLDLKILQENGEIATQRLLAVHKSIFPEDFPWAGRYRQQHVYVVDNFGTSARVVDLVQAESKVGTIAPESIDSNLSKLLTHWNTSINNLSVREAKVKIDEVVYFHHEFELIHPFLDGNGRIGRMLLEEQLSFLFHTPIIFRPERNDYYRALRMMNMGENELFVSLVLTELKKFNAHL